MPCPRVIKCQSRPIVAAFAARLSSGDSFLAQGVRPSTLSTWVAFYIPYFLLTSKRHTLGRIRSHTFVVDALSFFYTVMPSSQPLFKPSTHSSNSSHSDEAREEDALLGKISRSRSRGISRREWGLFAWATLTTIAVVVLSVLYQHQPAEEKWNSKPTGKRNLIFMVSDGMGPASLSLTRSFRQYQSNLSMDDVLEVDQYFIGSSRTRSSNSLVTDSAAGATAFSCGKKSYNGAISVLPDHTPCGTVLEAAKRAGYMTGLVVTTSITDATPACFASHVNLRSEEDLIAQQEVGENPLGRVLDLMLGGGRCHFLPNSSNGSCREDDRDITELAQNNYGWNYINSRKQFDDISNQKSAIKLPLMGLFADTDIPFEIDRRGMADVYPSLDEMAQLALRALEEATKDSEKGFFLMIEGSRIDHAGHINDPAAQVHEVMAYDKAFASVIKFIDASDNNGVLVATSDHETGGLSTARRKLNNVPVFPIVTRTNLRPELSAHYPEYLWYPEVLDRALHSAEYVSRQFHSHILSGTSERGELKDYINEELVQKGLGITDVSEEELNHIIDEPIYAVWSFAEM